MANGLLSYYASHEVIDKMPLPWNLKKGLKSRVELPIHPCANSVKKFFRKWKKDCSEMYGLHSPETVFEGGNMQLLLQPSTKRYNLITDKMFRVNPKTTPSYLRMLFDFYDICNQYEWHRHNLPQFFPDFRRMMLSSRSL